MTEKKYASERITRREFLKAAGLLSGAAALGPLLSSCTALSGGAQTSEPFKVGVLLPYTGVFALLGEVITDGMQVAFDDANNEAGGRAIELVIEDSEGTPDIGLQKSRKLVEQDNVDLVAGVVSSGVANGLRDYFHDNQKLLILSTAGSVALNRDLRSPYIFRAALNNWQPDWPLGGWAYENVAQRVFASGPDYAGGHEHLGSFLANFLEHGGELIAPVQWTPFPTMGDPAPFVTDIAAVDPDMIYITQFGSDAVSMVKALGEFGLVGNVPIVTTGFVVGEDLLPALGESALGIYNTLHWGRDLDNPVNDAFQTAYKEHAERNADGYAVHGYWTGRFIVEALNAVDGDTSDMTNFIDALEGMEFEGPSGRTVMAPDTHQVISHIFARQVQDVDGEPHNVTLEDLGEVADPGDYSKGPIMPADIPSP